ncbi:uncharacterized protein LOC116605798 isoform X2 [Nematostella vectensis]|uniref:uncharacterized protein LOC116605798 isoform X2 n=1 Tax=Nematostella vectensis TaxID=45351 RepID=UPI002077989A|nr:uncharacterized protein LOC116605798 isoform X2 [Nematostella vectensis]
MRHLAMIIWLALLTVFPSLGPPVVSQTTPYPANMTREPANMTMTMASMTREPSNITMAPTTRGQLPNMTTTPLRPRFKCYETNCTQGVAECQVVCKDSFMGLPVVPDRCTTARVSTRQRPGEIITLKRCAHSTICEEERTLCIMAERLAGGFLASCSAGCCRGSLCNVGDAIPSQPTTDASTFDPTTHPSSKDIWRLTSSKTQSWWPWVLSNRRYTSDYFVSFDRRPIEFIIMHIG